ncbi:GNAT family N-acetyltransferase [Amycolatopsis sp. NPDC051045]|uniref:GNAT family N-acetyltransferase n=1 Tax=Amycolatopsis sp. NPDC051045 TaxID=3156922 RepID=UPI00341341A3
MTAGLVGCSPGSDSGLSARPAVHHGHCFNGHDLDIAGRTMSYDHSVYVPTSSCNLCQALGLPRSTWFEIDLRFVHETPPTDAELVLIARPPTARAGVGQVDLQLRSQRIGGLDLWLCGIDRRGVIGPVGVDASYRRRGFGTVLVAAALARGAGYRWSTTAISESASARAFCAAQYWPDGVHLSRPHYCSHMKFANGDEV